MDLSTGTPADGHPPLTIIKAANVFDDQPRHVHRYEPTYSDWGVQIGQRCPCGLYQSGVDPRHALYESFTYDDY